MSVLVIGASGYLGGAIAAQLAGERDEVWSLSRSARAPAGEPVAGDVRVPGLGLGRDTARELRERVTHIVACFGSVDWDAGPRHAVDLHEAGMRNVLDFAAEAGVERVVQVSSVLVFGRGDRRVTNRELQVGQSFRTWYEYGKFLAERVVRAERRVPWHVVRFGPVLGRGPAGAPDARSGILGVLPYALRGYPLPLAGGGAFPCWVGEVGAAARVVAAALDDAGSGVTWTWFDHEMPTLAATLGALCRPWRRLPRIVDAPALGRLAAPLAPRVGLPRGMAGYLDPWVDLDPAVLDDLPERVPCPPGYLEETGADLLEAGSALEGVFG